MQWLSDLWAGDNRIVQFAVMAVIGIAILVALAIVYRVVFANRLRVPGGRTRQPRLGLVDAFSLDGQRQLVLVRRDNVEHLVMIGGPNDVLLESQINRGLSASRETSIADARPTAPLKRRAEPSPAGAPVAAAPPPAPQPARASAPAQSGRTENNSAPIRSVAREETAPAGSAAAQTAPAASRTPAFAAKPPEPAQVGPRTQPQPARRMMPPPIAPLGRANLTRLPEKDAHPAPSEETHAAPAPHGTEETSAPHPPTDAAPRTGSSELVKAEATAHAPLPPAGPVVAKAGPQIAPVAAQDASAEAPSHATETRPHPLRPEAPGQDPHPHVEPKAEVAGDAHAPAKPAAPLPSAPLPSASAHPSPFAPPSDARPHPGRPEGPNSTPEAAKGESRGPFAPVKSPSFSSAGGPLGSHAPTPSRPGAESSHSEVAIAAPEAAPKGEAHGPSAPHNAAPFAPITPLHRPDASTHALGSGAHSEPQGEVKPESHAAAAPSSPNQATTPQPPVEKHPTKVADPFAGLDSLEAEMAKLLGREKLG